MNNYIYVNESLNSELKALKRNLRTTNLMIRKFDKRV